MKKLLLVLAGACLLPALAVGQNRFNTGSAVLDNRLKSLEFFQRKYYSNQAFYAQNATMSGNTTTAHRLDHLNRLELVIACRYGTDQPGLFRESNGYVMFGAETPNGCKTDPVFAMVDDVFGTNIKFNITLNTYNPQGRFHYRSASYGLIDNAGAGLNNFLFMVGCNAEKFSVFAYGKGAKSSDFKYSYTYSKRKVRKLSELIALDSKGNAVMKGFKGDLPEGNYQLVPTPNTKLAMQHDGNALSLAPVDAKSQQQQFRIRRVAKNLYSISPQAGKGNSYLTRDARSKSYGTSSVAKPQSQQAAQQWLLLSDSYGSYYIINAEGCCMDVEGGRVTSGSAVGLWTTTGAKNQKWQIKKAM